MPADLRRFDEAAREYEDWGGQVQWFAAEAWNVTVGVTGREDDYEDFERTMKRKLLRELGAFEISRG